jgi:hypothetical protein
MVAVLGSRPLKLLKTELAIRINAEYLWSDSRTVQAWIRTSRRLITFVPSRVGDLGEHRDKKLKMGANIDESCR